MRTLLPLRTLVVYLFVVGVVPLLAGPVPVDPGIIGIPYNPLGGELRVVYAVTTPGPFNLSAESVTVNGFNPVGAPGSYTTNVAKMWSVSSSYIGAKPNGVGFDYTANASVALRLEMGSSIVDPTYLVAAAFRRYLGDGGPAPTPAGVVPGTYGVEGGGPYSLGESYFLKSADLYQGVFRYGAQHQQLDRVGVAYADSIVRAVGVGDTISRPNTTPTPPPNTGNTITSIGGISGTANYISFTGTGDFFNGAYRVDPLSWNVTPILECFTLAPDNCGTVSYVVSVDDDADYVSATNGIYKNDTLVIPNGTEDSAHPGSYADGLQLRYSTHLRLADITQEELVGLLVGYSTDVPPPPPPPIRADRPAISNQAIFLAHLDDFSVERLVQVGDPVPGGPGNFGVVQRPAISSTQVVFEGFDDVNFEFQGLFTVNLATREVQALARVGDMLDGREIRTLDLEEGNVDGDVVGFVAFFTDDTSAAYLISPIPQPGVAPFQNISTRAQAGTGDAVPIGGFIVDAPHGGDQDQPTQTKQVLVRAIGPSLGDFGVPNALEDPTLELHMPDGAVIVNDDWRDTQEADIVATTIPPANDLESAILADLEPGAYTAVVAGKNGGTGVGLVEVYDLDSNGVTRLLNISTRGFVDMNDGVMIGGMIVGGTGQVATPTVVRAIGPSLTGLGVADALQDPVLELYDSTGTIIASNDNWKDTQQEEIEAAGLAPTEDSESAISAALPPGAYTAIVRGANGTTGVGLVEAYNLL